MLQATIEGVKDDIEISKHKIDELADAFEKKQADSKENVKELKHLHGKLRDQEKALAVLKFLILERQACVYTGKGGSVDCESKDR
jgi:uncharacterized coiled-coil DUF342 family protein